MSGSDQRGIFKVGEVLNNTYRIEEVLGRGGTSEVYRARSEISGRVMALKALRSEYARDEDFLALMTREEDMREIRHDAVVRYYDNQRTDDGHVYLVMDYVEGPALEQKMKEGGMSAADLMIVARRVAEGLVAAHAKNIVHRDLSPDNIILRNGSPADPVIIDFGIAKDTNPGAETIVGNEFAGKYAYAAPEQLSGQTDARADIYALGALLLATFRGKKPDIGSNPMEVVQRKGEVLDTSGVPEPLRGLIDKMTVPDREMRLQTAEAVLQEIMAPGSASAPVVDDEDRTVIAPRPAAKPVAKAAAKAAAPAPKAKPAGGGSGSRMRVAAIGFAAFLALGLVAIFSGLLDGLTGPKYPVADPYTLLASRDEGGAVQAVGYAPSVESRDALVSLMAELGGAADVELASGEIPETWGADVLALIEAVSNLPEWRVVVNGDQAKVSGLTNDRAEQQAVMQALSGDGMPPGLVGSAEIELGPRILTAETVRSVLAAFADCGEMDLPGAPAVGYGDGATVSVTGRVAEVSTRAGLADALVAAVGNRNVDLQVEVLNPTLCLIDSALPDVAPAGVEIEFSTGADGAANPSGRFFVGENPVIDVVIPASITDGFLYVSALDVSGNVFHLLPNLLTRDNDVAALRAGREGPLSLRVAHPLAAAQDGTKLAFTVDDSSLGKTQILVLHTPVEIFDGLRPTTESAGGYATALSARSGAIQSLDSRILTTARKP